MHRWPLTLRTLCATTLMLIFTLLTPAARGEDKDMVYVDVDRSYIRSGPGVEYAERSIVTRGDALQVLERQPIWLKVAPRDGREGWILRRATTTIAPAPVVIEGLRNRIEEVQKENSALEERIRTLADTRQDVELEKSQLASQVVTLEAQVSALERSREFMWACLGVVVLLVGWGMGFAFGMTRKQTESRAQAEMAGRVAARTRP